MTIAYAPEVLIFTTSDPDFGNDEVLVSQATTGNAAAFVQISEDARYNGRTASMFLSFAETVAMRDQLDAIIAERTRRNLIRFTAITNTEVD